jgi:hypothetical protein
LQLLQKLSDCLLCNLFDKERIKSSLVVLCLENLPCLLGPQHFIFSFKLVHPRLQTLIRLRPIPLHKLLNFGLHPLDHKVLFLCHSLDLLLQLLNTLCARLLSQIAQAILCRTNIDSEFVFVLELTNALLIVGLRFLYLLL